MPAPSVQARIAELKEELAAVTRQCEAANREGQPGRLFFLLRKKWTLTQHIFQAESEMVLDSRKSGSDFQRRVS